MQSHNVSSDSIVESTSRKQGRLFVDILSIELEVLLSTGHHRLCGARFESELLIFISP